MEKELPMKNQFSNIKIGRSIAGASLLASGWYNLVTERRLLGLTSLVLASVVLWKI